MRRARLKGPGHLPVCYYHCVSRVVGREFLLGEREKMQFVSILRRWEAFSGVRVVTYCIMSNHFHLLVEVPAPPKELPSDAELVARVEAASGAMAAGNLRQRLERFLEQGATEAHAAERRQVLARMWDISPFMKAVKQQFTQWFNREHERRGTLWEERYKSVLVEAAGHSLATMACYIDLNPVRAGMVSDPGAYAWSGYGEATQRGARGRERRAAEGLGVVVQALLPKGKDLSAGEVLREYRGMVEGRGTERRDGNGEVVRRGMRKAKPTLAEAMRRRVRYFCDGAVFGSRAFVDTVFRENRSRFGPKRTTGARPLRKLDAPGLHVLRDLQVDVLGHEVTRTGPGGH